MQVVEHVVREWCQRLLLALALEDEHML